MSTRSGIMSRREALAVLASGAAWCASGCGASQDDAFTEQGAPGTGFAADLCQRWEQEALRALRQWCLCRNRNRNRNRKNRAP